MGQLRMALAQINSTVGDLRGNTQKILELMKRARNQHADFIAFPELCITGYPPEDLVFKNQFIADTANCVRQVIEASSGVAIAIGYPHEQDGKLYNAATVAYNGKQIATYHKIFLPTYGVFDEDRYFRPGSECPVFVINGIGLGISICEDIWYPFGPLALEAATGAQIVVNINASPYHQGKGDERRELLKAQAISNQVQIVYVNSVGGQDELVFDGQSMVVDNQGELLTRGPQFDEALIIVDMHVGATRPPDVPSKIPKEISAVGNPVVYPVSEPSNSPKPTLRTLTYEPLDPLAEVYAALVTGTRDYVRKSGHQKAVVGLSGGIDSSLTITIAADALGSENVVALFMPSQYTSDRSRKDAQAMAKNLGVPIYTIPIDSVYNSYSNGLTSLFEGTTPDASEENIQARVRGNLLMAVSNKFGWLVLNTGNKSEMATGYCTLYGDMAGGFAVLKDVPKTLVRQLALHRNQVRSQTIPNSIIDRPPSAELRPNQLDEDFLPPYDVLDPILKAYVEEDQSIEEMINSGMPAAAVIKTVRLVDRSEYKRRQAPPGVKITRRAFGRDRRFPIINHYNPS